MIQTVCSVWLMFGMMIDVDPKFYLSPLSTHVFDLQIKVTDFDFLC